MKIKVIKKTLKISAYIGLILVLLIGSVYALIRSPRVQTYVTHKLSSYFSREWKTKVSVDGVDIAFFNKIILEGVYVEDLHQDTLLYCKNINVGIRDFNLKENEFFLQKVELNNSVFNLRKYLNEDDLNLQFILDYFKTSDTTHSESKVKIHCSNFGLANTDFKYKLDKDTGASPYLMNFSDIHVSNLNGELSDVKVENDTIYAKINSISLIEKSGFVLNKLEADFKISPVMLQANNLKIKTPNSDIKTNLSFTTGSYNDYNDFIEKVYMNSDFATSTVDSRDIAFFTSELRELNKPVSISGKVKGTVNELKGKDLDLTFGEVTRFKGDVSFSGLPAIEETFIHLNIKQLETSKKDLEKIPVQPFEEHKTLELPDNFDKLGIIKFKGDFTGFINDFVAYGDFTTNLGKISSDISLSRDSVTRIISYSGNIKSYDFDAGTFTDNKNILGLLTMDLKVKGKGIEQKDLKVNFDGLVKSVQFKGYEYKNIIAKGDFSHRLFTGSVDIEDENVAFNFDGNIDFSGQLPYLDFTANVRKANLSKLNFYKPGGNTNLSTTVVFKLTGDNINNIQGNIAALNTTFTEDEKTLFIESLDMIASEWKGQRTLQMFSSLADAKISGIFDFTSMPSSFITVLSNYLPSIQTEGKRNEKNDQVFEFELLTKNTKNFTELFFPFLTIPGNAKVNGNYNSNRNSFNLKLNSSEIQLYGTVLKDIAVNGRADNNSVKVDINASKLNVSDSLFFQKLDFSSKTQDNKIDYSINWNNDKVIKNNGDIKGYVSFAQYPHVDFKFLSTDVYVNDSLWTINKNNLVSIDSTVFSFKDVSFSNNLQTIKVDGRISKEKQDELQILFSSFNLANLNPLLIRDNLQLEGYINGASTISNIYSNLIFSSNFSFKGFTVNKEKLGEGSIISVWNSQNESIAINGGFLRGTIPTVAIRGFYYPLKKENNLDFELQLQKTQLKLFERYIEDVATEIKGIASGDLILKGSLSEPVLEGTLNVQKAGFKIDYLNTSYTFSNDVEIKNNKILFNNLVLFDENGNQAIVNGAINHKYFKDITFDVNIDAKNFFCLNTNEALNSSYYGKAYTTGNFHIYGDVKNIVFDIVARTEKGTQFNIPLEGAKEIASNEFVRFIKKDTNQVNVIDQYKVDLSGIQLNFDLEVTPDAEVQIIFDSKIGDVIRGNGNGNLKLSINTLGDFKMFGDFVIKSGDYLFTLQNIVNKRFSIEQGGTISWNGDPYNADINLNAIYKVRAALSEILQDTTNAAYQKRVAVECRLKMTEKLLNPNIKFEIGLPTTDEVTKNAFYSKVNPENEQDVNRQIFALLLMNRFISTQQGDNRVDEVGSTTSSELLSNQLSNWLSSAIKDVDLGVKYRAGDQLNKDELEVAMRTQLFNNRISIDGVVGTSNNQSASNIVGDVNVEYKISQDGKLRVKAFNESNDYNLINNNAPYTQGVGVFFREDFDSFSSLIKRYKEKMKRRKEEKTEPAIETGNVGN